MDRRVFLEGSALCGLVLAGGRLGWPEGREPETVTGAPDPEPINENHFPNRLHLFVWRNWELTNIERMAEVLSTTPANVLDVGHSMGLPPKPVLTEDQLQRIYVTVIRQNWHILPAEQLKQLLGWNQEKYEYHLAEDDFLWGKLGGFKPHCEPLFYEEPDSETRLLNLQRIVERARRYGVNIYLYLNEPRAMPAEFVERYSGMKGTYDAATAGSYDNRPGIRKRQNVDNRMYAMCTSTPEVRQWIAGSVEHVFRQVESFVFIPYTYPSAMRFRANMREQPRRVEISANGYCDVRKHSMEVVI